MGLRRRRKDARFCRWTGYIQTAEDPCLTKEVGRVHICGTREAGRDSLHPKPSPIIKQFNSRSQTEGILIAVFVVELRKIAEHCDFGPMLRDRLVCGTNVKTIQRRLLIEPVLTFEKALERALVAEAIDKDSKRLTGATVITPDREPTVNKVGHAKPTPDSGTKGKGYARDSQASPPANVSECCSCGRNHLAATCYCTQFLCHFCKKRAHERSDTCSRIRSGACGAQWTVTYPTLDCDLGEGTPLLSRDWLSALKLDWSSILFVG